LTAAPTKPWPVLSSIAGYRAGDMFPDLLAGLTLAAVAIPEQMATARLGNFPPQFGFFAFIAATIGFCVFGANRRISVGSDSTITPIFAGSIVLLAAAGGPRYLELAAALALMVGALVLMAGLLRMGWVADLLSVPVTIGFLAGIAVHIIASQLPSALGVAAAGGSTLHHLAAIVGAAPRSNPYAVGIAAGVLIFTALAHRLSARLPGALIAMAGATAAVVVWGLEARGVAVLGQVQGGLPGFRPPTLNAQTGLQLAPLALLIAIVILVQTAATTRAFPSDPDREANLSGDLVGVGVGNLLAGLLGAFPVNASPPRTAVVAESGGRSQIAGLAAVAIVVLLLLAGTSLLSRVPQAALSGVLLFIALRIIRFGQIVEVARSSPLEFVLIIVTAAAIIVLPIATGVAVGIGLSLMHGMWSSARPRALIFERLPGTTVWWPKAPDVAGETLDGVIVLGFQAPLSFLNAYAFRAQVAAALATAAPPKLLVLEASGVIDIDFTGAEIFKDVIRLCREAGAALTIARLEGVEAQRALTRLGLRELIGDDHIFPTVAQAIDALAPSAKVMLDKAGEAPPPAHR